MTSSTTKIQADTDGTTTTTKPTAEDGLKALRSKEARQLISIACDAVSAISGLAHQMHTAIYDTERGTVPGGNVQAQILEALTCLETAEHYLRMLDEVIDPGPAEAPEPKAADPVDPWAV